MAAVNTRSEVALVLAGGEGRRMLASGVDVPKPLVQVGELTLLEINVRLLLHWGYRDIVVAISDLPSGVEIGRVCRERHMAMVEEAGGRLELLVERFPMGNIGCAGLLKDVADVVVAVYADNVTTLDLRGLMKAHRQSGCAMTVATHEHLVRVPYGQIRQQEGRLIEYVEKPTLRVPVASGVNVLGADALAAIAPDRPTGFSELAQVVVGLGLPVAVFPHAAEWVDVNEAESIPRAKTILTAHRSLMTL